MWGHEPWNNDRAADWFASTIGDSGLALRVRETLQHVNALEYLDDEVTIARAACYSLLKFGYVYVWPISDLKNDLKLGIAVLEKVLEEGDDDEKITLLLETEINELKNRLLTLK